MNDWDNYVVWTRETAQYPEVGTGSHLVLAYLALGLIGEVAELLDAYNKAIVSKVAHRASVLDEAGDVYWYLARFDDEFGVGYQFVLKEPTESSLAGIHAAAKLTGKLANDAKKVLRQDDKTLTRMGSVIEHVDQIGLGLRIFANAWLESGQTFNNAILAPNQRKLMDRKARNVIKGSGDNR